MFIVIYWGKEYEISKTFDSAWLAEKHWNRLWNEWLDNFSCERFSSGCVELFIKECKFGGGWLSAGEWILM